MSRKKLNPLEDPPTASSSEEDELETLSADDEEEQISDDSSSEEEDDLMNPVNIPSAQKSNSRKPIHVSKPKVKKRPIDKTSSSSKEVDAKRAKKVSEDSENKITEETKKPLFQRLWSEEDEIYLLQGMIDFKADTGKSPYEDMDRFYELTIGLISFGASKNQFVDKIRCLKRKYMGQVKKGVESLPKAHEMECLKLCKYIWGSHGLALNSNVKKSEKKLEKSHGKEVVEEEVVEALDTAAKSNGALKKPVSANGDKVEEDREVLVSEEDGEMYVSGDKVEQGREVLANDGKVEEDKEILIQEGGSKSLGVKASDWFEDSFLVGSISSLGVSEQFLKQKWSMVTVETKKRMEDKWKLLQAKEMELVLHKTDFMHEIGSVIAEAS